MKDLKDFFLQNIPELFFIGLGIWLQLDSGTTFNPLGTGLVMIMTILLMLKSKILAGVSGGLLFLGSLYLVLALLSDFHKYPLNESAAAYTFLAIGGSLIFTSIIMALTLVLKASRQEYRLWVK